MLWVTGLSRCRGKRWRNNLGVGVWVYGVLGVGLRGHGIIQV